MIHQHCIRCCNLGRKECEGKEEFPGLPDSEFPECYRECTFECPFDDCPSLVDYPPDNAEVLL